MIVPQRELEALVGHAFPGGRYRIAHWENFLLTEATGAEPLPDGLAHPAHLFHAPIHGVGISIAELFELGRADSDASVTIDYYDWEYPQPLREEQEYDLSGGIVEHERRVLESGPTVDSLTFRIELRDPADLLAARSTIRWHFWRFAE
ncbi:MAG: hypothetical protein JRG96_07180 [Deltaproteobacteria bacterium]|nr:hypothetical protein [Deltaproteobacteria bacterium]MBW2420556.1 hypothetical protein [Deltaproteobacteria bacterium]